MLLEIKKIRLWFFALVLAIICIRVILIYRQSKIHDENEVLTKEYIGQINKKEPDQQTSFIIELLDNCNETINKRAEMDEAYSYARISFDEYHEYNNAEDKAKKSLETLKELQFKSSIYDQQRSVGKTPGLFYDKNVDAVRKNVQNGEYLMVGILIIIASTFALLDRECKMDEMTISSCHSGRKLHFEKLSVLLLFAFVSWLILCAGEYFAVNKLCTEGELSQKLYSLMGYSDVSKEISIASFFMMIFMSKLAAILLWTVFSYLLSGLIKNRIVVLFIILSILLVVLLISNNIPDKFRLFYSLISGDGNIF